MEFIPAPDFPTAGIINGRRHHRGLPHRPWPHLHARPLRIEDIDKVGGRQQIVITELPYQVNKARLIEKIAELVKEKKIEGITELRDESDKDGMRIVIELRAAKCRRWCSTTSTSRPSCRACSASTWWR
jgi:DNA gyrase subunit A